MAASSGKAPEAGAPELKSSTRHKLKAVRKSVKRGGNEPHLLIGKAGQDRRPEKRLLKRPDLPQGRGDVWWRAEFQSRDGRTHSLDEEFTNHEGLRLCVFCK